MKSSSNVRPNTFLDWEKGKMAVNYNITERETEDGVMYDYDTVIVSDPVDYSALVSAMIKERYTIEAELAILRQRYEKESDFQEYYDFVENCKSIAREICK